MYADRACLGQFSGNGEMEGCDRAPLRFARRRALMPLSVAMPKCSDIVIRKGRSVLKTAVLSIHQSRTRYIAFRTSRRTDIRKVVQITLFSRILENTKEEPSAHKPGK